MSAASTASAATPAWTDDLGKLVLRLTMGVLVLLHGLAKLGSGPGFIVTTLTAHGFPGALGYLVYVGEILAPVLLLAGLWTRAAAALVVINMVVAILLVHTGQVFALGGQGGWALELQGLYLFGALAIVLLGAGRHALGGAQRGLN